jgi:hypothetical protein
MSALDTLLENLEAKLTQTAHGDKVDNYEVDGIDLRKRAPNAIEWVVGPQFLNKPSLYVFTRQYQVIRDFFQLRCPICNKGDGDCWGKTEDELRAEVLLVYSEALHEDHCPKCGCTRLMLIEEKLLRPYNTMIGIAGMRSGKSVCAGFIGTYLRHIYTTLGIERRGILHDFFRVLATQYLELAFVASTATQSKDTIWANFFNQCAESPWFKAYRIWVKTKEALQTKIKGILNWRYNENTDSIEDGWCMFNCVSLHSNSGSLAGRTRVGFLVDELSRFGTGESKLSGDEVWAVFDHSLKTVRGAVMVEHLPDVWMGTAIAISSPMSIDDKTMQLFAQSQDLPNEYGWRYATWDFNPKQPRANFDADYAKDPVTAERDFGANPPNGTTPLIANPLAYWSSIDLTAKPSARFESYQYTDKSGRDYKAAKVESADLLATRPLYIFGDAGLSFDQFALSACSAVWLPAGAQKDAADFARDREDQHFGKRPEPMVAMSPDAELTLVCYHEWSLRIIPERGRQVWFESIVDIIRALLQKRNIVKVAFDHWNSQATLQQLGDLGIATETLSLKVDDFSRAVQDAYLGRLRLLPPAPDDLISLDASGALKMGKQGEFLSAPGAALYEMLKLERTEDLKRVFNPNKGKVIGRNSDDVANTLVGAHRLVQESMGKVKTSERQNRLAKELAGAARWRGSVGRGW